MKGLKRQFIREKILNKLADAGDKGLTIYEASVAGPGRSETVSTSTATKILEDFKAKGLVTRKEEGFRAAKPYVLTPTGRDVLEVAETVSDSKERGEPMTIGELVKMFGEERVINTVLACLLRYRVPSPMEYEAVACMTKISFLHVVSSAPLRKNALLIREIQGFNNNIPRHQLDK